MWPKSGVVGADVLVKWCCVNSHSEFMVSNAKVWEPNQPNLPP